MQLPAFWRGGAIALLGALFGTDARGQDAPPAADPVAKLESLGAAPTDPTLRAMWRNGLRLESDDQAFAVYVSGRAHFDAVSYLAPSGLRANVPGDEPLEDGVTFRRLRLAVGGTAYTNFEFLVELDFFNGFAADADRRTNATAPTDAWVQFKELPWVGNVRVGNHKPRYGFEHLTSSRFLNFLERSPGFDSFVENGNNGFAPGLTAFDAYADGRGTWSVGVFKNTRSVFARNVGRNEAELNARVTFLPIDADDGARLVHVGVGGFHRDLDDDATRYRSRFSARSTASAFAPLLADTGEFEGRRQQALIPEFAAVFGPLSLQAEYYAGWVQGTGRGSAFFHSVYGEAHLFLTGEHREYDRALGAFGRVKPLRPVAWSRGGFSGCGAWQLAARYSYLDLNDRGINGGLVHDMTLGVNWFLNPNMKVQGNYFLAHRNVADPVGDGYVQGFGVRTAFDF